MLETLHIENFRCLRKVELKLTPLTALVGPNGSGKTAVLDALVPELRYNPNDAWRRTAQRIRRAGRFSSGQAFEHAVSGSSKRANGPWSFLKLALRPEELGRNVQLVEARTLDAVGGNLANVFATLSRKRQGEVAARLRELVPLYSDVHVRPQAQGQHRMVFQDRWDEHIWYEPHQVSEGTRVLMAFLVLAHSEEAPDILGIEDPEHALHPYLVGEVVRMLRQLAHGALGPKSVQVILATHSAQLLNFLEPSEVRFMSRRLEDGSTVVREAPTDSEHWQAAYNQYEEALGEMWLSGSLGGVPGLASTQ